MASCTISCPRSASRFFSSFWKLSSRRQASALPHESPWKTPCSSCRKNSMMSSLLTLRDTFAVRA